MLVDTRLAHAKDEVLNDSLIELADGAQVEHRVDGADGVPPLTLVANSCLSRKTPHLVFFSQRIVHDRCLPL